MGEEELEALVIDSGSSEVRAGFSGYDAPRAVFPSAVGRFKSKSTTLVGESTDVFVGDEAMAKSAILNLSLIHI